MEPTALDPIESELREISSLIRDMLDTLQTIADLTAKDAKAAS